jgi:hypothetical protein
MEMPLRDHFHPPLVVRRHWHGFHNAWATYLASALNKHLPEGYFAEPNVQFGIEIDVATWKEAADSETSGETGNRSSGESALWTPPAPVLTIPFTMRTDTVEVAIFGTEAGPTLVGAIELVSPANKDRPEHRDAFIAKCETYLQQGVGLVLVDIVTNRTANLHHELLSRLGTHDLDDGDDTLYTSAYHPVDREDQSNLDIWYDSLHIGDSLPTLPLYLRGGICLPVNLDATYEHTCQEQRIG